MLLLNYYVFRLPLIFLFLAVHNGATGGEMGQTWRVTKKVDVNFVVALGV